MNLFLLPKLLTFPNLFPFFRQISWSFRRFHHWLRTFAWILKMFLFFCIFLNKYKAKITFLLAVTSLHTCSTSPSPGKASMKKFFSYFLDIFLETLDDFPNNRLTNSWSPGAIEAETMFLSPSSSSSSACVSKAFLTKNIRKYVFF